jgi:hypothetical protein
MILAVMHGCWYDVTQISARGNIAKELSGAADASEDVLSLGCTPLVTG